MELCCFKCVGGSHNKIVICSEEDLLFYTSLFVWIRIIIIIVGWNDLRSLRLRRIANRIVVTMDKDRKIDLNRMLRLLWSICNSVLEIIVHELQGKRLLVNIYRK